MIEAYKKLDAVSASMKLLEYGETDGGYPVHLLVISKTGNFTPLSCDRRHDAVFLVMNGIHPGESEGIDASLIWAQQMAAGSIPIPDHVTICIIPVYNVDGMLNRRQHTRTNQNGPVEKGFRGNGRNLDLNRDFIKADAKNTFAFYRIYHSWDPDVFLDNHTSNGADYQYTMTLISTQREKLGGQAADLLYDKMVPALYKSMADAKWEMIPYVHLFGKAPDEEGYEQFIETPKFSTGYTSLFGTLGFVAETHMLKPYQPRVEATLQLMKSMTGFIAGNIAGIREARMHDRNEYRNAKEYATNFIIDKSRSSKLEFKGFEAEHLKSELGNYQRLRYNRDKPYSKEIPYYNFSRPLLTVRLPRAYIVPRGWHPVVDRLKAAGISMQRAEKDTVMLLGVYHIAKYESLAKPYEGHHTNYGMEVVKSEMKVTVYKGDYIVPTAQAGSRYIAEVLEPQTEDGFFAWNFFDAILGAKEGFSDYVFEDDAVRMINEDPALKQKFEEWKAANPDKLDKSREVLGFIFKNSHLYEQEHMRIPVYRLEY